VGGGLAACLASRLGRETVVVGMGNPQRGDDAAGCLVARGLLSSLAGLPPGALRVVDAEEVPESFLGPMTNPPPDTVVLVDAMELGEVPGTVAVLEVEDIQVREGCTHRAPLSLLAHFVRVESGAHVFVVGIQPETREMGAPVTPEVVEGALSVVRALEEASRAARGAPRAFASHLCGVPRVACAMGGRPEEEP
jgi:hydrogenase maturation protease